MASVSEAADCQGSRLSGSEPMFIRTTVASPPLVSEVWPLLSEAAPPLDAELPLVLVQPAKAATARAKASTRLRIRFCIVFFLLCFYFFLTQSYASQTYRRSKKHLWNTRSVRGVFLLVQDPAIQRPDHVRHSTDVRHTPGKVQLFNTQPPRWVQDTESHPQLGGAHPVVVVVIPHIQAVPGVFPREFQGLFEDTPVGFFHSHLAGYHNGENMIAQYRENYNKSIDKYRRYIRKFPTRNFLDWTGYEVQDYEKLDYQAPVDAPQNLFGE